MRYIAKLCYTRELEHIRQCILVLGRFHLRVKLYYLCSCFVVANFQELFCQFGIVIDEGVRATRGLAADEATFRLSHLVRV